jgi:hypothetical protein
MSSTLSPTLQAERRSWHYWFEDGLPSLLTSAGCLLIAFFMLYPRHHSNSLGRTVLSLTAAVLYGAILIFHRQILDWLKARITYPRTGYVSPPYSAEDPAPPLDLTTLSLQGADARPPEDAARLHADRKHRLWFAIALTLVAIVPTMFVRSPWICSATGVLLAAAMWFGAKHEQRLSWIVLAGFPIVGFWMSIFLSPAIIGPERVAYFLAGAGALFFLDGAVSLIRYLLRNPQPTSSPMGGEHHV